MKWNTRQNYQRCKNAASVVTLSLLFGINNVLAKMPELQEPTQGKQKGIMATLQAYAYDAGVFIGLLIVSGALYIAAKNCLTEYSNIGDGKGSWGKFGAMAVIGILLVVLCIWLGSLAADTLLN